MKIRKSKYHQKSVKVVHCGALIWRKFSTNCDAHLLESTFQIYSRIAMNISENISGKTFHLKNLEN